MRTTLDIDDDILAIARSLAASRQISLGRAVSQLAREGLRRPQPSPQDPLFPVFEVGPDDPPVTPEMIKEALEDW